MEIDYKAIGQRIKIARIKKGITQEAVADLIDITPAHMSNVETGKTKVSLPTLIEIANALSVSVDVLLCDNVLASQNFFQGEAQELFEARDEYATPFLVDPLKGTKSAMRWDKEVRTQFNRYNPSLPVPIHCVITLRFFFSTKFISHTPDSDDISWIVWVWFDFQS